MRSREPEPPRVLSLTPGRLRVHLSGWQGEQADWLEARLGRLRGVERAEANPLTGNILIHFDPRRTTSDALLAALARLETRLSARRGTGRSGTLGAKALRCGVRGLVGHAVVDTLLYTLAFAEPFGLPLATLAKFHLGLDVLVWGAALTPLLEEDREGARRDDLAAPAPGP